MTYFIRTTEIGHHLRDGQPICIAHLLTERYPDLADLAVGYDEDCHFCWHDLTHTEAVHQLRVPPDRHPRWRSQP